MESASNTNALELITSSQRALYGYIYSLVGARDLADEILQETNVVLCRKIREFDGRVQFTTWACRIAYFEVLAKRKSTMRDKLTFVDQTLLDAVAEQAQQIAEQETDYLPLLRECMKELPRQSSELIESRYQGGGSVQRIAQQAGRTSGAIRVALHRIRGALLACIERKLAGQA